MTLCLVGCLLACVFAQASSVSFRGLSVSDGLSDLLVNALYKDNLGYVWIGTGNSLDRFDGIHVRRLPVPGADEKRKRVYAIAETSDGSLWMGNGSGLWRVNRLQTELEQMVPDKVNTSVYSLFSRGDTLYIGTERGLFIYHRGTFEHVLLDQNAFAAANVVQGICADDSGLLWLATRNGLYSYSLSNRHVVPYHYILAEKHQCSFQQVVCMGNRLFLGTMERGLITFDIPAKQFAPYVNVGCNVISSLSTDGNQMLYVGTDGNGIHFIDVSKRQVVRTYRHEPGDEGSLRSNSVYSLLVDREGIIWAGFYQLGLDYTLYQNNLFSLYAYPPFFSSKDLPVRALSMQGSERLIGSRDGLFYVNEANHVFKSFQVPQMRSSMVFCITFYRDRYYVGTYGGGMYVFNPDTQTLQDFDSTNRLPFFSGHIFCLSTDAKDRLWMGTSQGLYCYDGDEQVAHYTSANSKLPEGNVYEVFFDSTGKGWICTENGMCIWDPSAEKLRTDVFPEGFIHKEKIRVVFEDSEHQLYFFPDKGALFISDLAMNRFRRLEPGTPLDGKDGLFMIEDDKHTLWLGTSNGLFRYNKLDRWVPYNFIDGIPSNVFTLCPPILDESGNLWLGNTKGLLRVNLHDLNQKEQAPYPLRVTDILVNGQPDLLQVMLTSQGMPEVRLKSSQKNLTFCISDFSFSESAYISYEYKLEGKDDAWQVAEGTAEVSYYDLSSGIYRFKVRRMGKPETETMVLVQIATPWGMWLLTGTAVLLLISVAGYQLVRRRGRRRMRKDAVIRNPESETAPETKPLLDEKYKTLNISAEECARLAGMLDRLMRVDKVYMNSDLKVPELAAMLGISAHTLSYLFNQHLKCHYYDYLNDFRIAEFKRLVQQEEYARYTLSALADLCGFSSRASFFRYFKKATGITPNEYIRGLGK